MTLPDLDQVVELERGMAAPLHRAVRLVQREMLHRDPTRNQRLLGAEALALRPLGKLLSRLTKLAERDAKPRPRHKRPAKPHQLTLPFDQLVALRLFYARLLATAEQSDEDDPHDLATTPEQRALVLTTALGKFHQRSLNLASHITLPPALGPVKQGSLFP